MKRWKASDSISARLRRRRAVTHLVLVLERLWPAITGFLCILAIFLIVSWLGVWTAVPLWFKLCIYASLIVAFTLLLRMGWVTRYPTSAEALRRLDAASSEGHQPAQAATDSFSTTDDVSRILWAAHQTKSKKKAAQLRLPGLHPQLPLRDPLAFRAAVLIGLVAAGFVAGSEKWERALSAFQFSTTHESAANRTDAWVDPPAYTGRPPIVLMTDGLAMGTSRNFLVPIGAAVVVRSHKTLNAVILSTDGLQPSEKISDVSALEPGSDMRKFIVRQGSHLVLKDKHEVSHIFSFAALPDNKPTIEFQSPPSTDGNGLLSLLYNVEDDYGVASAEAIMTSPTVRGRVSQDPLFERPTISLSLSLSNTGNIGNTLADMAENPWAGVNISIRLIARDELGNEGSSNEHSIEAPQRKFTKPLAKAIIEQRRNLSFFPAEKSKVIAAIEGLVAAPDRFRVSAAEHLSLRFLVSKLQSAKNREDLRESVAFMWEMALRIEEGDLQSAEQELRSAEKNLQSALENGSTDDELRRLTDELRMAMERFLKELANREAQNPPNESSNLDQQQIIGSRDLNKSIDDIERLARSGNLDEAKNALEQLRELLRNLKSAKNTSQGRSAQESNKALNQLDQMLRDQQDLRDRTYDSQRKKDERSNSLNLKQEQNGIRQRLEDLQRRMRQFGMRTDEGLEDAEDAMRDAERQLGEGPSNDGDALSAQGRAIEGLKKGAESLARQLRDGEQGEGMQAARPQGGSGADGGSDPLGRESRTRGDQSRSIYDPMGATPPQRSQQLLEELRRRLGEPSREALELEYLERLMRRY